LGTTSLHVIVVDDCTVAVQRALVALWLLVERDMPYMNIDESNFLSSPCPPLSAGIWLLLEVQPLHGPPPA